VNGDTLIVVGLQANSERPFGDSEVIAQGSDGPESQVVHNEGEAISSVADAGGIPSPGESVGNVNAPIGVVDKTQIGWVVSELGIGELRESNLDRVGC